MSSYLRILEESLRKKLLVLDRIRAYNEKQSQVFQSEQVRLEEFDAAIEEKGKLIDAVNKLDEGFEILYANVAEELKGNKEKYTEQIKVLQQLVKEVTDKSMEIQAQEARNKALVETYFSKERNGIRQGRKNSQAALNYYRSMSNSTYTPPQFLDSKK